MHSGNIPRYHCTQPQDVIDKIIKDLKEYNKTLIYEDKSLAQQIEKYLQEKRIREEMRRDRKQAEKKGQKYVELSDQDFTDFKNKISEMKQEDDARTDQSLEQQYAARRVSIES